MNALHLDAVRKEYRRGSTTVVAVEHVERSVEAGECVVLRGASGAGKSTTLHLVGGITRPSAGSLEVFGQDPFALGAGARAAWRRRTVGFVFQEMHLLPYLDARANLLLAPGAVPAAADAWLDRLGLAARATHRPHELSVGEKQRVALARALLGQPRLLLADEPTGNLDPGSSGIVVEALREYRAAGGTLLVATHAALPDLDPSQEWPLDAPTDAVTGSGHAS